MVIYVSSELENIKTELLKKGYNVASNNNMPCDVIICNLKNGGLTNLNFQSNARREGTLIIDSGSKTIDQIEYILNNRVYSSLFY
ncbi:YkuS family protein [Candidatus Clostridium radicumherbarum]|uniref:YkuS family protein n=1 Tax=Candidatus Clostridium radicumherbarum TaxID=3381662 RepID=A0ABW8TX15_9CLOT